MAAVAAVALALSALPLNQSARVLNVAEDEHAAALRDRLHDLGFITGEAVRVMAHALGGDPIAVRIGHSTFALRRAEAACVLVQPDDASAPAGV